MNLPQRLWWRQALSDYQMFRLLRSQGAPPCHLLHYLQMSTEKLSKAYFWRTGQAPRLTHLGLVRMLTALGSRSNSDLKLILPVLHLKNYQALKAFVRQSSPIANGLQRIAPALAGDGPNAEYPWRHETPTSAPCQFDFPIWQQLQGTGPGRQLLAMFERMAADFEKIA